MAVKHTGKTKEEICRYHSKRCQKDLGWGNHLWFFCFSSPPIHTNSFMHACWPALCHPPCLKRWPDEDGKKTLPFPGTHLLGNLDPSLKAVFMKKAIHHSVRNLLIRKDVEHLTRARMLRKNGWGKYDKCGWDVACSLRHAADSSSITRCVQSSPMYCCASKSH